MRGLRPLAAAGALLFVAGGLAGWFTDTAVDRRIPAHHLVSIGAWAWVVAVPLLLAPLAPWERRWLKWLWLTAAPLVLLVGVAGVAAPRTSMPFPFFEQADERHIGLAMSLVGSLVALLTLLEAWSRAPEREDRVAWRRPVGGVLGIGALAAAVTLGVRDREREAVEDRIEAQIRMRLAECSRPKGEPVPDVRVRCREAGGGFRCAQQVVLPDGTVTEDETTGPPSATATGC